MYFKTKNFASFVRQLNMYGFHKVKNDRGVHEFKHPQFKKGHYEELAHIKRKNILIEKDDEDQQNKELDAEEFIRLRDKLEATKVSLETVTQQNMNLISANKDVAGQLYGFKQDYENRLSKFFFMFYFLVNSKEEGLSKLLKKTLMDLGIYFDEDDSKTSEQRILEASDYISNQILLNPNTEHTIMNKLLNTFTFFVNVGGSEAGNLFYQDDEISRLSKKLCFPNIIDKQHLQSHNFITSEKTTKDCLSFMNEEQERIYSDISHLRPISELEHKEEFSSFDELSVNRIYNDDCDMTIQEDDMECFVQICNN